MLTLLKKYLEKKKAGKPFSGNKEEALATIQRLRSKIKSRLGALENSVNHNDQLLDEAKALTTRFNRLEQASKLRAKKALAKNAKIGSGIVAGTVVLGTGAYLYNKNKKKKEED